MIRQVMIMFMLGLNGLYVEVELVIYACTTGY